MIKAYAAPKAGGPLEAFSYNPGPLAPDDVEIKVEYCGVCHSDLSMLNNDWGNTSYPFVPGHEIVGVIAAVGSNVSQLKPGDRVGLGWFSQSCMHCEHCMAGDHNFCKRIGQTIVGRHGGFADRVRCQESWAIKLPGDISAEQAGPLFCGGITVFNPLKEFAIKPTDRVGVVGIGGLGHLALQFLNKWGCDVTAFSSTPDKSAAIKKLGAHRVISSKNSSDMAVLAGTLDFILVTSNVTLDWNTLIACLAPRGRLHIVGAVVDPIALSVFSLLGGRKSVSSSPLGGPATTATMLAFAARHNILPVTETFPMSKANDAMKHLEAGKARYRVVLKNDF